MNSNSAPNIDIKQLDDYLVSISRRLQTPVIERLRDFENRRVKLSSLLDVAGFLNEGDACSELRSKLDEVDSVITFLRRLDLNGLDLSSIPSTGSAYSSDNHTEGNDHPPAGFVDGGGSVVGGPTVDADSDESEHSSSSDSAQENSAGEGESEEVQSQEQPVEVAAAESLDTEDSETDTYRIAEAALRESRRRGFIGNNNNRSYDVTPANSLNLGTASFQQYGR